MAKGFKAGVGGGAALNFKVVSNPQPASPRENTIWLNTDVPIGAWYFSATQPENMAEGDVWFPTGTSSPVAFNALKKNGIQVYPGSAKQYVGGALVDVTAHSYQGGEWATWITYLFHEGDKCEFLTGGWTNSGYSISGYSFSAPVFTDTEITMSRDTATIVGCGTENKVTLTNYEKIVFDVSEHYGAAAALGVLSEKQFSSFVAQVGATAAGTFELDISNISGDYFIVVLMAEDAGSTKIRNVYMK